MVSISPHRASSISAPPLRLRSQLRCFVFDLNFVALSSISALLLHLRFQLRHFVFDLPSPIVFDLCLVVERLVASQPESRSKAKRQNEKMIEN
uniref:Uncharacterized protein n=1 Tax=Fagus sylvatica TaxID=28930 RepID=A0A2N9GH50_FAGSY